MNKKIPDRLNCFLNLQPNQDFLKKFTIPFLGVTVIVIGIFLLLSFQNRGEIRISKMNSFSEVNEDSAIVISDIEEIKSIKKAVKRAERLPGISETAVPQFKVEMGRKSYFLWISEESGAIMDVKDTHTLYELSNKSVEQMNRLVTSKFY